MTGERLGAGLLEHPVGQRHQVRLEHARGARRRWSPPVRAPISTSGCAEQQSEDLAPGVPAGSGDGDTCARHVHDYTDRCMTGRTGVSPSGRQEESGRRPTQPEDATREVATMADVWSHGDAYERFMGRWSRLLAPQFLHWLRAPGPGCGGRTSAAGAAPSPPRSWTSAPPLGSPAVDPSRGAGRRGRPAIHDPRVSFGVGTASNLPAEVVRRRGLGPRPQLRRPTPTPLSRRWPGRHRAASWRRTSGTTPRGCRCCGRSGTSPASSTRRGRPERGPPVLASPTRGACRAVDARRDCDDVQTRAIIVPTVFDGLRRLLVTVPRWAGSGAGVRRVAGRGRPRTAPRGPGAARLPADARRHDPR